MSRKIAGGILGVMALIGVAAMPATAQSFRVPCPTSIITHPDSTKAGVKSMEPAYNGPTALALNGNGFYAPTANVNGAVKCQQVSCGDDYTPSQAPVFPAL